jgi:hypothetical protein
VDHIDGFAGLVIEVLFVGRERMAFPVCISDFLRPAGGSRHSGKMDQPDTAGNPCPSPSVKKNVGIWLPFIYSILMPFAPFVNLSGMSFPPIRLLRFGDTHNMLMKIALYNVFRVRYSEQETATFGKPLRAGGILTMRGEAETRAVGSP